MELPDRLSQVQRVREALRSRILCGDLLPGSLIAENVMRREYNASVRVVRGALTDLAAEGLLIRKRHLGTVVAERTPGSILSILPSVDTVGIWSPYSEEGLHSRQYAKWIIEGIAESLRQPKRLSYFLNQATPAKVLDELPVIHRPLRGTVQGLITIDAYSATALSEMVRNGVPVVALDFHTHGAAFDSVCFDHLQAGFLATEHLRRLGHKQVAFLGDRPNEKGTDPAWQDRLKGYLYAMSCSDPEKGSNWVLDIGRGDYFIRSKLPDFHARHNPTAYVLASSRLAPAVLSMLTELGLRCPEDVSLACADSSLPHIEREGATNLQLSCARNSFRELGCMAVRLLASRLSSPAMPPLNVTLPVSFQSGGTSQPLRH